MVIELVEIKLKTCSKCGIEKERTEFYRSGKYLDGLRCSCKECCNRKSAEYHLNNKEKMHIAHNNYFQKTKISRRHVRNTTKKNWQRYTPIGYANKLWRDLNSRTINGYCPDFNNKNTVRGYLSKGVELRLTRKELFQFVVDNWDIILQIRNADGRSSIDRIGPSIHYELDNIRFIPLSDNIRRQVLTKQI